MNKRHYEHTLPNIRGSLSNTYTISYEIRINVSVTGFQFPYQRAFGHPAITE